MIVLQPCSGRLLMGFEHWSNRCCNYEGIRSRHLLRFTQEGRGAAAHHTSSQGTPLISMRWTFSALASEC